MPIDILSPLVSASPVGDERQAETLCCAPFLGVPSPFGGSEAQAVLYPCRSVHECNIHLGTVLMFSGKITFLSTYGSGNV